MQDTSNRPAATLADVAKLAGTSTAVVSYVVNDGPRPVAAATRRRVEAAIIDLGYRPNRMARALRSGRSGVIGLALPDAGNPYFSALARHLERALDARGLLTLIGNSGYAARRQQSIVAKFAGAQVDGLIVVATDGSTDVAGEVAAGPGTPCVYVHHRPVDSTQPLVAADNDAAPRLAIAHLRQHGHEKIAFLAGPDDTGPAGLRVKAWRAARGGGLLLRCAYSRAAASDLMRNLAAAGTVPDALVTATDEQAIGALAGACAAGVAIPDRLAVISLDGTPDSEYTAPALTVTRQPLQAMSSYAVARLLDRDAAPPPPAAPLVVRRSCGCTPAPTPPSQPSPARPPDLGP